MKPVQGSSRPSLPSADDHTLYSLIIIVAGSGVLGWMLWSDYHTEISTGFVQVAHWHIQVIRWFTPAYDQLDAAMLAADPRRMTLAKLHEVSISIGGFFRWPAALLLASLGVLCFLRAAPARFTRKLDLVPEYEDRVPAYVEQMFDRLEASGIIVGWDRGDWNVRTTSVGLDVRIAPRAPEASA